MMSRDEVYTRLVRYLTDMFEVPRKRSGLRRACTRSSTSTASMPSTWW